MKVICTILLCHIGWLSATLMIYHEASMKEFGGKITTNKASFGYSVTYTPDNKRLIVSAPKASDHGALFSCDINGTNCTSIPIGKDIQAPKNFHIWLGATVRAGSNFFMTCAPRYSVTFGDLTTTSSRCFKYLNYGKYNSRLMRLTPLPQSFFGSNTFEHKVVTFGWSMDIDGNDNALIGGPAMFTGRAVKYDYSKINLSKPPVLITPGNPKAPFIESNFGYSVVHRKYNSEMQIAVSSTYGVHGYGMVVLYNDKDGAIISKIQGKQVGAMFGASLCAARVDPKGQALLLVGAPTYTSIGNKYNTGAVFVYKDEDLNVFNTIEGMEVGSQFGYALANLGDLNGDYKDEIAIAAPYEDEGRGAVYIFSGAQLLDPDKVTWLQKIQRREYRSFGLSLYAIPDHDQNGCKELAIGIPENNEAVLFSCLATITVAVKQLKAKGKINDTAPAGWSSFMFESCLAFQYPVLPKTIAANFSLGLDIPKVLFKLPATGQSSNESISYNIHVTSDKKTEYCKDLIISVPTDKTYDPTLQYQISAVLLNDPKYMSTFDPSRVTVSDLSKLTIPGTIWIGECENGDKCIPKLEMDVTLSVTNIPYVVGSTYEETVRISVQNSGDPAYEACVQVLLYGVDLLSWPASCMLPSDVNSRDTLICSPITLLRNNTSWDIEEIKLDMKSIRSKADGGEDKFDVQVHLFEECSTRRTIKIINNTTPVHWDSENVTAMGLYCVILNYTEILDSEFLIDYNIIIARKRLIKDGGVINITRNEIETSSKQIQHEYEIANNGPTTWYNVRVEIYLEKEFYLEGISPTSGRFYDCTPAEETNMEYINHCVIPLLKSNTKLEIKQPIDVTSKIYETLKKKQLKVISNLKVTLDGQEKLASVITTLRFYEIEVPTWIIVVAVLFGLLIIAITVFILYECGFLRRKKKEDLTHLRRSVRRQSMRRTTMIQHNVDISEKERLIEPAAEDGPDNEAASSSTKVEVNEKVDIHTQEDNRNEIPKKNCDKHKAIKKDVERPVCDNNPKELNAADNVNKPSETSNTDVDTKIDRKPSVKAKKSDPIAGIIIGGLQKNIRHRGVLPNVEDDQLVE